MSSFVLKLPKLGYFGLGVLILVLFRFVVYLNYLSAREMYFSSDNAIYAILSKRFLEGDLFGAIHPYWNPGFPIATVPSYLLLGSWEKAQVFTSMISVCFLIIAIYLFYKTFSTLFAFSVAFITTFSAGIHKLVLVEGITEPLYILLLWLSIFTGWKAINRKKLRYYAISGTFFGASYLTRTDVVGIFAVFLLILLFTQFVRKLPSGLAPACKFTTIRLFVFIIFFTIINIPYITVNSIHLEKLTFSGKYANMGSGPPYAIEKTRPSTYVQDVFSVDYPDYNSPYYDSRRAVESLETVVFNGSFSYYAKKGFKESLLIYRSEGSENFFQGNWLGLAVLGFFSGLILNKFRKLTIYLSLIFFGGLIWTSAFMSPHYRYLVFAYPFFFYLQGLCVYAIALLTAKITPLFKGFFVVIITTLLLGYYLWINFDDAILNSNYKMTRGIQHIETGNWIKSQGIKVICAHYESLGFYANAKTVYMPSAGPEEIVEYMKYWGVEYLIISPEEVDPAFAKIAYPNYKHPDLELIKVFDNGKVVWKLNLTPAEKKDNQRIRLGFDK